MHKRLFIPGPVEVSEKVRQAMGTPMVGHRSPEYSELHGRVTPKLRKVLYTEGRVFLSTSSATGIMEGAVRNQVDLEHIGGWRLDRAIPIPAQPQFLGCLRAQPDHHFGYVVLRNRQRGIADKEGGA